MAIQFPADPASQTPVNTLSPNSTPIANTENALTYVWNGNAWVGSGDPAAPDTPNLQAVTDQGNTTTNSLQVGPPPEVDIVPGINVVNPGGMASASVGTNLDGQGAQNGGHLGVWYADANGAQVFTSTGDLRICTDGALQELESSITLGGGLNPAQNNWLVLNSNGDAEFSGNVQVNSLNSGPLSGFRNQLMNSQFAIWQRSNPPMTEVESSYTADRWRVNANIDQVLRHEQNNPPGIAFGFDMRATAGLAMGVFQAVELLRSTNSCAPFNNGSEWTFSVWSSEAPEVSFDFADGVSGANGVQVLNQIAMTSTGEISGVYTKYKTTFPVSVDPAASNLCLVMRLRWTAASTGDAWLIAGPQLEPGPECTPLEMRPIATELASCARYFQKVDMYGRLMNINSQPNTAVVNLPLSVAMRLNVPDITQRNGGTNISYTTTRQSAVDGDCTTKAISAIAGCNDLTSGRLQFARGASTNSMSVAVGAGSNDATQFHLDAEL